MENTITWRSVGSIENLALRAARRLSVSFEDKPIAIFRTGDNEVFALIDVCPHRGGPLSEGIVSCATVTCPLHNWTINLKDGSAVAPDEGLVRTLPVIVRDNEVLVGIPRTAVSSV